MPLDVYKLNRVIFHDSIVELVSGKFVSGVGNTLVCLISGLVIVGRVLRTRPTPAILPRYSACNSGTIDN